MQGQTIATTGPGSALATRRIHVMELVGNAIVGGMECWVERLLQHLPRERFRITVVCPYEGRFSAAMRALGADVVCIPMPEDPAWSAAQLGQALARSTGVDLLHAHLPNAHALGGLVSRLTDLPLLCTVHGRQLTLLDLEVHRAVRSHLSVVCRHSYLHALGVGVDRRRLSCEPNGVDTRCFHPGPRPLDGLRHQLGMDAAAPLVGFVGRLSPEKGPEQFLRAAALLAEGLPPGTRFVMVGEGPLRGSLEADLARLGLGERVRMAGQREDMSTLYRELDVLVSCSHSEAMPLAVMEGLASGVPVVGTRVGGMPEIVQHGVSGWLVAPRDIEDLAGRIRQLLDAPERRQAMGAAARRDMVERLDLRPSLDRVAALMQALARQTREPHRLEDVSVLGRA